MDERVIQGDSNMLEAWNIVGSTYIKQFLANGIAQKALVSTNLKIAVCEREHV